MGKTKIALYGIRRKRDDGTEQWWDFWNECWGSWEACDTLMVRDYARARWGNEAYGAAVVEFVPVGPEQREVT